MYDKRSTVIALIDWLLDKESLACYGKQKMSKAK